MVKRIFWDHTKMPNGDQNDDLIVTSPIPHQKKKRDVKMKISPLIPNAVCFFFGKGGTRSFSLQILDLHKTKRKQKQIDSVVILTIVLN